jgi:hypothetical protein
VVIPELVLSRRSTNHPTERFAEIHFVNIEGAAWIRVSPPKGERWGLRARNGEN